MTLRKNISCSLFTVLLFIMVPSALHAKSIELNKAWKFYFSYDVRRQPDSQLVNLPHTWNAKDVLEGKIAYKRDAAIYERQLEWESGWSGKRLFLYFRGANSVASVFVNNQLAGEHIGGYTAFCFEITNLVKPGELNKISVWVSNAYRSDLPPLAGDFNIYGGLHRGVDLLVKEQNCISPLDFASSGVYISTPLVSQKEAIVKIDSRFSIAKVEGQLSVKASLLNAQGEAISKVSNNLPLNASSVTQTLTVKNPRLWNGKNDPYLYKIKIELLQDGRTTDSLTQPLGLRFFRVDAEKGFMLNGKKYDLYGVGIHEDVMGKGSALLPEDRKLDQALLKELSPTALRLTHYPHDHQMYEFSNREGLVLWTEIPLVGPGGYTGTGYIPSPALERNAEQMLKELILQNYNHPSVFFLGLFNELKLDYGNPLPFLNRLNELAKKIDPGRLTVCASFLDNDKFNGVSDLIAWNKYFGWYDGMPADVGIWADRTHSAFPSKPIALSEYGAGGSPFKHTETLIKPVTTDNFHPEEWQTYYHEENWAQLKSRSFLWGKFIWVFADFGSSIRSEGDSDGINDKGLITYDRAVKKDAFYFYKANWNNEPMLYLAGKRNTDRISPFCTVKAYSNLKEVELELNGQSMGKAVPDQYAIVKWENVSLRTGKNTIKLRGRNGKALFEESCVWIRK